MPKLTTGEGLWGTNMNDLKRKKKNMSLKGAVIQLPFLILSIKCLMRHVELNVSENLLMCKRQNHSFLSKKYVSQALCQTLQTTKMSFEKHLGWGQVFKNARLQSVLIFLVEVSPSVLPFVVLCCLYLLLTF